ncbi:methyltransferase [Kutzneria kofuensis]|uniref:O-methyltransferase n=1 Tax=Kutzneria kofuensis TaxID=103725 RepID=A0A7W9NE71_9PSEU|nr:methyltransferase [Kutzneria kofuensis]MBB5890002.1 hypothetical protein [Kutzneria kofuensis]
MGLPSISMGLPSIMSMVDLATPMAIRVAATLNLVEHAGSAGATVDRLAADTGTSAPILRRLLDHLVAVGVFDRDSDRYRPTALGMQLTEDGFKPLLDINRAGGRADLAFVDLLQTITTGASAYTHRYGREFWADLDAHPHLRRSFDAQMAWRFANHAARIASNFDWGRFGTIIDAGGGDGNLLAAILQAHPGVRGTVVDLAPTTEPALARFAAAGLSDRATAVAGSFFEPLPAGADAYVLSDILHDWDDDHCRTILARCRDAAGPHGAVIAVEPLIQGAGTGMDLFMLMCFGGRERTVDELAALAAECGLTLRRSTAVSDGRTALEFGV